MIVNNLKLGTLLLIILPFSFSCTEKGTEKEAGATPELVDYVNPYMGNISHLLVPTYPTVHLPNSMLRVIPERSDFTTDRLKGLPVITPSHRRRSAFTISPVTDNSGHLQSVYDFSYDHEDITPYGYEVYLDEENIKVSYAVSHQSGIYSFEFSGSDTRRIIFNNDNGKIAVEGNSISGHQYISDKTRVFVYAETDTEVTSSGILRNGKISNTTSSPEGPGAAVLQFDAGTPQIKLRYGISFISEEQAKKNLYREISGYDLEKVLAYGRKLWNEKLSKTLVKGGNKDDKIVFYTSVYRTYERPVSISEDGRYWSGYDNQVHHDNGVPFYTDDWIWDTYRATHPLRVLTEKELEVHIIKSFIRMAEQMDEFWMPTFPEVTGDSRRMNSNHGVATILDAYVKGVTGFDLEKAYEASKGAITEKTLAPWSGMKAGKLDVFYKENGYIPALREGEEETIPEVHGFENRQPVAVTLGTVYDEWCLAQIAKILGKQDDYQYFLERSYNYRKIFNEETGFFHPKDDEGKFIEPFSYKYSGGLGARAYYGENNGWVYRWDVPHNVADLIELMGGRKAFINNLEATFSEPLGKSKWTFYAQLPDHTGNVGQFSMANEPSLHIPYLYNYAGEPWRTQKRIKRLIHQWFRNDLMGLPGDEDGGGMSAFVAFSMMGFYPVTPGAPSYNIGSPFFEEAVVDLGDGNTFTIKAENFSEKNKYIQSATLNGKPWDKPWFHHEDIANGGVLELEMGPYANKSWGSKVEDAPPSAEKNF